MDKWTTNMKTTFIAMLVAALGLVGCGKDSPNTQTPPVQTYKLNGLEYLPIAEAKEGLVIAPTQLGGTGNIVFRIPRPKDNNYVVDFSLPKLGSLTLVANGDTKLKNGANVTFTRGNDDKLQVFATTGDVVCVVGTAACDLSADFAHVDTTKAITMQFDIHEHGHIIHFENGVQRNEYAITKVGGTFWGLKLSNAVVTKVAVDKALNPE